MYWNSYLWDIPDLEHQPFVPARPGIVGEGVYLRQWQRRMAAPYDALDDDPVPPNARLALILDGTPHRLCQRDASLAASFMTWLGTNGGQGFLALAHTLAKAPCGLSASEAYLAGWALQNRRQVGVNSGYRTLEFLLAENRQFDPDEPDRLNPEPRMSVDDLETMECLVVWLGREEGQSFLAACQQDLEVAREVEAALRLEAHRASVAPRSLA